MKGPINEKVEIVKKNEYMKMDIWLHMIGQNTRENIDGMLVKEKI